MPPATIYPEPLVPGCRIVVTAPSSGVEARHHARLDLVLGALRDAGFTVEEGQCLRTQRHGASAPADARADELMAALGRDDVAAVIPPWGGELAIELLDRVEFGGLAGCRPKWVLGYSDTSTWMLPLTLATGWATAHGPCLMDLAPGQRDALTAGALAVLATPRGGSIVQRQSGRWQRTWTDFATAPASTYALTEPTRWRALDGRSEVRAAGRLIGGCLDTLVHLAGTPHGAVPAFIAQHFDEGVLLYLENAELSPAALVRAAHQLRWCGWLDGLAALLIGRSAGADTDAPGALRYADALAAAFGGLPCPVLADVDIGHRPPQLVLVNGARAEVAWGEAGGGTMTQRFT